MLTTIIGTTIGFAIASILMFVVALALIMNKKFLMWYTKKIMVVSKELADELMENEDLY